MSDFVTVLDLVWSARRHLRFLEQVNRHPNLYEGNLVSEAIYRYEKLWLPLAAKHPNRLLLPPLDIRWIWHVHMLSPLNYQKDCNSVVGTLIATGYARNTAEENSAIFQGRQVWETLYPNEKIDLEIDRDWSVLSPTSYESKISYDIHAAVSRQKIFYYQVSLPHFKDQKFLDSALRRYKQYLMLKKTNPFTFLVPCYDMDLIWHTHQGVPDIYARETTLYLGDTLNHDDSVNDRNPGSKLVQCDAQTRELWKKAFNENFVEGGAMFRGNPPVGQMDIETQEQCFNKTANKYTISIKEVHLEGFDEKPFLLTLYKKYRNSTMTHRIWRKKGPEKSWVSSKPEGFKMFSFDTSEFGHLNVVLEHVTGACCFQQREILGSFDLPFLCDSTDSHFVQRTMTYNMPLSLDLSRPTGINVKIVVVESPLLQGPLLLRVQPESFKTDPNPSPDVWGPVPLPAPTNNHFQMAPDVHISTQWSVFLVLYLYIIMYY